MSTVIYLPAYPTCLPACSYIFCSRVIRSNCIGPIIIICIISTNCIVYVVHTSPSTQSLLWAPLTKCFLWRHITYSFNLFWDMLSMHCILIYSIYPIFPNCLHSLDFYTNLLVGILMYFFFRLLMISSSTIFFFFLTSSRAIAIGFCCRQSCLNRVDKILV